MSGSMRECSICRRLLSSSVGRVCQDCVKYLEEIYPVVRSFIRDSKDPKSLEIADIADALEIPIKYVQGLVNSGYLSRELPNAKSDDGYEDKDKEKLSKELQKATDELKANASRKSTMTYGQERYTAGKK